MFMFKKNQKIGRKNRKRKRRENCRTKTFKTRESDLSPLDFLEELGVLVLRDGDGRLLHAENLQHLGQDVAVPTSDQAGNFGAGDVILAADAGDANFARWSSAFERHSAEGEACRWFSDAASKIKPLGRNDNDRTWGRNIRQGPSKQTQKEQAEPKQRKRKNGTAAPRYRSNLTGTRQFTRAKQNNNCPATWEKFWA